MENPKKMTRTLSTLIASLLVAGAAAAQQQRVSPHETTSIAIGGKKITIEYGRPYVKDRKIFGGLVPYGEVWRTGADEATKLTTEADLTIGSLKVPKGTYALFTLPTESGWTLIVNTVANQWGAFKYDQARDLGRTPMKVSKGPKVEQFTISLQTQGTNGAVLRMAWDTTVATAAFTAQ
jgi:hypothetical protein